jgi:hypothetical protein
LEEMLMMLSEEKARRLDGSTARRRMARIKVQK